MDGFVDRIRQYDAQEQVDLRVRISVPGHVFDGLTEAEKRETCEAQAVQAIAANRFPKCGACDRA